MILFRDTGHLANRFAVSQVLIQVTRQPLDATYANMINAIIGSGNLNRVFVALILHGLHGWTRMPGKDNFGNPIVPLITPNFFISGADIFSGTSSFEICDEHLQSLPMLYPIWEEFVGLIGRPSYVQVDVNHDDITLSFLFPSSRQRASVSI